MNRIDPLRPFSLTFKRLFDLTLAGFGILFFLPLGVLFALTVKAADGGPVFYFQERWGREGKKFRAYKFRTMVPDADKKYGLRPAEEHDERVTPIGKFLRVTAMDELPQLINILKGDMSFVGPRALATGEVERSAPHFLERHQMAPGLTGPAQVYAPRIATLKEKFAYDLEYIRNRTFFGDLKLIFLSVWITLRAKWETREKKI